MLQISMKIVLRLKRQRKKIKKVDGRECEYFQEEEIFECVSAFLNRKNGGKE